MQNTEGTLKQRWGVLEGRKGTLHTRCEQYARWTLPYLYPRPEQKDTELDSDLDSLGAQAVNHLSNKLISTLFPAYRPFLRLEVSEDALLGLERAKVPIDKINEALAKGEKRAMRNLDKMAHRTAATEAAKYLIVTGNALLYYPDGKAQVYNTRNYCIVRDLSGNVIEIMTRDMKAFETFSDEVQTKLKETVGKDKKQYEDVTNVTLYTRIKLEDGGKYHVSQAADMVPLDTNNNTYAKKDLPWLPLAWNLVRGEDYGRGMVEDYRGAFGALDVLTKALVEGVIAAAAIKFLVNPASVIDVEALNKAANGTYHSGKDGDVVAIKSDKHLDFEKVRQVIDDYQKKIAMAFLLNSAVTRDAERVTAEEIRFQAQELETAYGGIYSRFTEDWQMPVANMLLSRDKVEVSDQTIYPVIVTGLDTLSRLGDIDNYRMMMEDLTIIGNVPEPVQRWIDVPKLVAFVGTNRGVDYGTFMKTADQVKAEDAQMAAQQKDMMAEESGNKIAENASKELAKEDI